MSKATTLIPELKELDNLLRCGICYDYMKNTLITSCSHNYCSYCIRKFMQYKSQCPTCFKESSEPQLRCNRLVDQVIGLYEKVCEKIEDITYDRMQINGSIVVSGNVVDSDATTPQAKKSGENIMVTEVAASKMKVSVPDMFTPRRKPKKPPPIIAEAVNVVPCPVCNVDIPERNINMHLDNCLAKAKEMPSERISPEDDRRKPLPKLVYPLLQEKDLRKKLKELGLSALGDRKALVNRHQRYVVLYNSECDSLHPRPVSEILDQVALEEKLEKRPGFSGNTFALTNTWLTVNKKMDGKTIEMAQKQYLNENKNSFAALIDAVKRGGPKKSAPVTPTKDGPSCSTSRPVQAKEEESSAMKSQRPPLVSSDEERSSPEICVIPHDQPEVVQRRNSQSSFDMFDGSSPNRASQGSRSTCNLRTQQLSSPSRPSLSGTWVTSQVSPGQSRGDLKTPSPPPGGTAEHSSLDSFPSPPPSKCETAQLSLTGLDVVASPDEESLSAAGGASPPLVCHFSPNLGAKFQASSDHERTPSPLEFDLGQLSPEASPPVLRKKRRRVMMKPLESDDEEGNAVAWAVKYTV
ncbi:E3 ubiquitin-protein ligase RAD18-like [Ischnura elegans]|uniref:E3 ubiquitin-protein ligase RAD18-like n=1 Tax=Ischnura elegans TaxID=197161 RepID=UPI001ED89155|nr:E3 ubiquitin-protein ligase RAD18-like [Ischnura elegans]